jgi:hypothetical protein
MRRKKITGIVLLVVGISILVLSLGLDIMGFGRYSGFGSYQIGGTIVGVIVTIVGVVLTFKK